MFARFVRGKEEFENFTFKIVRSNKSSVTGVMCTWFVFNSWKNSDLSAVFVNKTSA